METLTGIAHGPHTPQDPSFWRKRVRAQALDMRMEGGQEEGPSDKGQFLKGSGKEIRKHEFCPRALQRMQC